LVEFAVVSLVVYMLLAAILTFGQLLYCAQTIQQAADVVARETSRTPLPAAATDSQHSYTLNYVLYTDYHSDSTLTNVRQRVFDDNLLVLTIDQPSQSSTAMTFNNGHPIGDFPLATQQLLPVMIYDQVNGQQLLRYPGAIQSGQSGYTSPAGIAGSGYIVRIPLVSPPSGGTQTITAWVPPVEPILDASQADAFALNAITVSGQSGIVALRINYPYQSATMSGFQPNQTWPPGPPANPVVPITADSSNGTGSGVPSDFQYGPYAGPNGLGRQAAWGQNVQPYRSLISAQAIFRREVFQ
jgi:Flp pilus assembly protein TadG